MARLGVQPRKMGTTSAPHRSHRSRDFPVVLVLHSFLVLRQHPVQSPRVRRFTRVPYFTVHPGVFSACTHASVKLAEALAWDRSMCSVVLRATIEKRRDIRRWGAQNEGSADCARSDPVSLGTMHVTWEQPQRFRRSPAAWPRNRQATSSASTDGRTGQGTATYGDVHTLDL